MSQKDFTDWGGRKRKEVVRPAPERPVLLTRKGGKKDRVGIKTKVDRYKQTLLDFQDGMKWRRKYWAARRERGGESCGWSRWGSWRIKGAIRRFRRLNAEYMKDGSLVRVREEVGLP